MPRQTAKAKSGVTWPVHAEATETIAKMYAQMVYANVDMKCSFTELVHACFPQEVIHACRTAYTYVASGAILDSTGYGLALSGAGNPIRLQISGWAVHGMCPIAGKYLDEGTHAFKELVHDRAVNVAQIVTDVGVVAAVLDYFHEYGTPASTRYYFPSILSLAKRESNRLGELSKRFREPADLGMMTPFIRQASETVAKWLLIPDGQVHGTGVSRFHMDDFEPTVCIEGRPHKITIPAQVFRFVEPDVVVQS